MKDIIIPSEITHLDLILEKCKYRMRGNHYAIGEWEALAKSISGSNTTNPNFEAYVTALTDEGYIIEARKNEGSGDGCIATIKGLLFEGFESNFRSTISEKERLLKLEEGEMAHRKWMFFLTLILCVGTTIAAVYYWIEVWHFFHPQ